MVGDRALDPALGNPSSFRRDAGNGGRLATTARRTVVVLVAPGHSAAGSAIADRNFRHHQLGKETASHREDPGPHGAAATGSRADRFRGHEDQHQHLQGRGRSLQSRHGRGGGDVQRSSVGLEVSRTSHIARKQLVGLVRPPLKFGAFT